MLTRFGSMPGGHEAVGSISAVTTGLNTYRRSQTTTAGGNPATVNASFPTLSISQNGAFGFISLASERVDVCVVAQRCLGAMSDLINALHREY